MPWVPIGTQLPLEFVHCLGGSAAQRVLLQWHSRRYVILRFYLVREQLVCTCTLRSPFSLNWLLLQGWLASCSCPSPMARSQLGMSHIHLYEFYISDSYSRFCTPKERIGHLPRQSGNDQRRGKGPKSRRTFISSVVMKLGCDESLTWKFGDSLHTQSLRLRDFQYPLYPLHNRSCNLRCLELLQRWILVAPFFLPHYLTET